MNKRYSTTTMFATTTTNLFLNDRTQDDDDDTRTSGVSDNFYDVSADNPLCLCEYVNQRGQRSHLLMCCCNCDAFDTFCTNLCCGDSDHRSSRWRLFLDVLTDCIDRVRVPCPGGARPIDVDFLFALVSILVYLYLGTYSFLATLAVVFTVPVLIYARFFSARMSAKTANTSLAFYILLVSFTLSLVMFNHALADEIAHVTSLFERRLVNLGLVCCLAGLVYLKNSNPGFIPPHSNLRVTGSSEEKCSKCQVKRDPMQSGHCPICRSCVYARDHHCFWVDNCIGYLNHRPFVAFLVLLLTFLSYSMWLITRRLGSLQCKLNILWYSSHEPIADRDSYSCLFDVFYANSSRAVLMLLFVQLIPCLAYLGMLIFQQACFISIGLTQNQLFKMSQVNVRFSLAIFLVDRLSFGTACANLARFLSISRIRRTDDYLYNDHLV